LNTGDTNQGHRQSRVYGSWPDTFGTIAHSTSKLSIYCNYGVPEVTVYYPPYPHTKAEKVAMWKSLWDATSNTDYFSGGKSTLGNDIWVLECGTQGKPIIMIDAELHGNEDNPGEALYLTAKWLLTSGSADAKAILDRNCIFFVPIVNIDTSQRTNANGVNLNRNFKTGWSLSGIGTSDYSGPYAASEKETQVMRNLFSTYKPAVYINLHAGAGPYMARYRDVSATDNVLNDDIMNAMFTFGPKRNVTPFPKYPRSDGSPDGVMGSVGYAIGDAYRLGINSPWLVEAVPSTYAWSHDSTTMNYLKTTVEPRIRLMILAASIVTGSGISISTSTIAWSPVS